MNSESQVVQITSAIFSSSTNITAFVIILILSLLALFGTFKSKSIRLKKYAKQSPSILATIGILFSFWGISIGLIGLDLKDMQNSIPSLLDGLKVKFIASLMGIFASIIVRVAQSFSLDKSEIQAEPEKVMIDLLKDIRNSIVNQANNNPDEVIKELKNAINTLSVDFKGQQQILESIRNGLAGEGDASITTQLGKMRLEMRDGFSDLNRLNKINFTEFDYNNKKYLALLNASFVKEINGQNDLLNRSFNSLEDKFADFAKVLAENNSKAFIEALEKAMRDFNNNITEQFGDNFKQLNLAVGKLLEWQEKYKSHVETLTANFEIAVKSVDLIKASFGDLEVRSKSFTEVSSSLHKILQGLDLQLGDLKNHLSAFDDLSKSAKNAFPLIEDNMMKLTTGFKSSAEKSLSDMNDTVKVVGDNLKESTTNMRATLEKQKNTLDVTSQDFKKVVDSTLKSLSNDTKKSIDEYRDALQVAVVEQLNVIESSVEKSNGLIDQSINKASTTFEKSINLTNEALTKATNQLTNVTGSMNSIMEKQEKTLVNVSSKFEESVNKTLTELSTGTQKSLVNYQNKLEGLISEQANTINSTISKAGNAFDHSVKDVAEKHKNVLEQQIKNLDNSLQEELRKSIELLGRNLASLSRKFVDDYSPLTDRLREVVRLADAIKRDRG
ncbi:MAG: hypothetical protein BWK73_28425 [Thiothrix lacustris]|uniref:MotA/TolQ/ExbB proton channel domain-containing protein n=1 Tax=Thiothrix lacustris TaxID=525917 RepID=A0A1Y1QK28_9GAMM|nr:MAG: hypothetical protein BWK73_28425 [Thiothrix lacustris]